MKNYLNDKDLHALLGTNINDSSIVLLQANNEYSTRNYQKSLEILTYLLKSSQSKIYIHNNIGCVHFNVKKYGLSSFYYRKALSEISNGVNQYELIFNLGISLLFNKQPLNAFDCFIDVITYYKFNSRLWLRIAECCILAYRSQNDLICKLSEKIKCIQKTIGINIYHKLVFTSHINKLSSQQTSLATLEFAYMCLRNALVLLPQFDLQQDTDNRLFNSFQPSNGLTLNELKLLKCSILIAISYVSLNLNDFLNTIKYCNILLNECNSYLSKGNRYLALQYLAEALYNSDRVNDSIEKLNNAFDDQNEFDVSFDLKTPSIQIKCKSQFTPFLIPSPLLLIHFRFFLYLTLLLFLKMILTIGIHVIMTQQKQYSFII
jgi:CCR4-NOT transcription complex subunit 10